jgi:CDP-glycerol glycerophosphotransferase
METTFLGKPAVSFAYDLEHYQREQDGLLYDLSVAFPGPVCTQFKDVVAAIGTALDEPEQYEAQARTARTMFFKYRDAENSHRLCERVKAQLNFQPALEPLLSG